MTTKRYILTGTPGAGKTTLINALCSLGYETISEAATDVIVEEQSDGVSAPWLNSDFIEKVTILQQQRQKLPMLSSPIHFFDRSPVCTYALCLFLNREIPHVLRDEVNRIVESHFYESDVFFVHNLGFIETSAARKITFTDAIKFEKLHLDVYRDFGFNLIHIPALPIEQRYRLIVDHVHT